MVGGDSLRIKVLIIIQQYAILCGSCLNVNLLSMTNFDWIQKIGLLPIDFLHNQAENQKVSAMLDGSFNNFCIGYNAMEMMNSSFRDKVWSANMSNYLLIDNVPNVPIIVDIKTPLD